MPDVKQRFDHTAIVVGDSMYVWGGLICCVFEEDSGLFHNQPGQDLWRYDVPTRKWVELQVRWRACVGACWRALACVGMRACVSVRPRCVLAATLSTCGQRTHTQPRANRWIDAARLMPSVRSIVDLCAVCLVACAATLHCWCVCPRWMDV